MSVKNASPPLPQISPNSFSQKESEEKFVVYKKLSKESNEVLKNVNFANAENFDGNPLISSFKSLVKEFNEYNQDSEMLKKFAAYLNTIVPPASYKFIAASWPPVIPNTSQAVETVLIYLIKIISEVENPQIVLNWLSTSVFPLYFTREQSDKIIAITSCKSKKKPDHWAVLTKAKEFTLYSFKGNDATKVSSGTIDAVQLEKDGLTVDVMSGGKVLASFAPEDPQQTKVWQNILNQAVPFPKQISMFKVPVIDEFYTTLMSSVVNIDSVMLRAFLNPEVSNPKEIKSKNVLKRFFNAYAYSHKQYTMISNVFLSDLANITEENIISFIEGESNSRNIIEIISQAYGQPYINDFIKRLAVFIDETGDCGIGTENFDFKAAEKLIVNVIKFICFSHSLVPNEIKQTLNIFRTYVSAKTNNREIIYRSISEMFLRTMICSVFQNIKKYVPNVQNTDIFSKLANILYIIFSHSEFEGEFEPLKRLQKRLNKSLYKLLYNLAIEVSENTGKADFAVKGGNELARGLEEIAKYISAASAKFNKAYDAAESFSGPSLLGTNVTCIITSFFTHSGDTGEIVDINNEDVMNDGKKKKKHKYVKATSVENLEGKVVKNMLRVDPTKEFDPTKKYYKKVHRQVPKK